MTTHFVAPARGWLWRALAVGALALGLAAAPAAYADDAAPSTITIYAPDAAVGASVSVQRQTGYGWVTVPGSTMTLFSVTYRGVPYATWTVDPADYDQGPFRWVVENLDGSVWSVSDPFFLPAKGGLDLALTLGSTDPVGTGPLSVGPIGPVSTPLGAQVKTMPVPAYRAPELKATASSAGTLCNAGDCAAAEISVAITGLPIHSWIAVEWQDAQGYWHPVENWEGPAELVNPVTPAMYQSWSVMPELYGRGPFRWAIYSGPHGGVLGVSPSFNLPSGDRQNSILYLSN